MSAERAQPVEPRVDPVRRGGPGALDHAETQARSGAYDVAAGRPAAVRGIAARTGASPGGVPLPWQLKGKLETSLGVDLSTVRVHADVGAVAALQSAQARAMTVGEDISIAPGLYRPDRAQGRALLAHEATHVVQQRATGVRAQYDDGPAPATEPGAEPVWLTVSLHGLGVTSPQRRMPAGEVGLRAYGRVILRRLAPDATTAQIDTAIDALASSPGITSTGMIAPGHVVGEDEKFTLVTINPGAFADLAAIIEGMGVRVDLTPAQRRILRLGVTAGQWAAEAVATLRASYPWYTEAIWRSQLDMQTQSLAEAADAEESAPAGTRPTNGRDALIARLRPPLDVLEATRVDQVLTRVPAGSETPESRDAATVASAWRILWGESGAISPSDRDALRGRAIQFYWTAPELYDGAVRDRGPRADFLRRLDNWFGRTVARVDTERDVTQELVRDPGRFTDRPFPAHLEAVPAPGGDLRVVPAHVDHRYRFSVDFTDVFDALGRYAYRWDVLGWVADGQTTAQAVRAIEAGHTDAGDRRAGRRSTGHGEVLAARLGRDLAHARADANRLADTFGPASVAVAGPALGLFELRGLSTVARTLVDTVTLEHGAGVRERMIQLPGPGLWVIRAAAVPLFETTDEIHRAPSIAYIPVFAVPQQALAEQALDEAVSAAETAERDRLEARTVLTGLTGPDADPALRAMALELAADPRLSDDRWLALQASQTDMVARAAQIRASLDGTTSPPLTPADATLLRSQLSALDRQIEQNRLLLNTHRARVGDHPALASPHQLHVAFVTDDGQTLNLSMDWAEVSRQEAPLLTTATAPRGSHFVILSDHTSPNGGLESAAGSSVDAALRNALTSLLEGRTGYGRGLVAVRLPSGRRVTFRIEASLGSLFNEAVDAATTIITLAALAAAPFTAGASLTILVPVGIVAGLRAAERMYARYDASTLRWDMQTLQDFVDVASAAVGLGSIARGTRAGFQVSRIGRIAAVSFDVAQNVTGLIILGVGLEEQLRAIESMPGLSDGERRSRRMLALGGALVAAGMQGGSALIAHAYGPRPESRVPPAPGEVPPIHAPDGAPRRTVEAPPTSRPVEELPSPRRVEEPPAPRPTEEPPAPRVVEEPPAVRPAEEPPVPRPGDEPTPREPVPETEPPTTTPIPTPETAPAPRPTGIDDLLTPEGRFRPEHPELTRAWETYADRSRGRGRDPLTPREWALRQTRGAAARELGALLPEGWRRGTRAVYPGARPEAVALDVPSPQPGTRVVGSRGRWSRRVVQTEDLVLRMDSAGEQYWSFPDLVPGEVLVLPNGSRIWIDPSTGAIVDSNPVGASISALRATTRGEEVMFAARDRSDAHVAAGTQRLHGATSPGLGGDAPYSIAGGPRSLNLSIENSGIEAWVRLLRDNAPPGVTYVYTTRTQHSPRGDLISRSYDVAAMEGGRTTEIAGFDVHMRGGGITDADVVMSPWRVSAAGYERYGAPRLRTQPASRPPGGDVSVDMPRGLRIRSGGGDESDATPSPVLTEPLEAAQRTRARLGELTLRADMSERTGAGVSEALIELDTALVGAQERIAHGPMDPRPRAELSAVVTQIDAITRIRTRTDRLSVAELNVMIGLLDRIAPR